MLTSLNSNEEIKPADTASTSQVTSARSGFSPTARNPPYIPAALKPFAAVTPPGIWNIEVHISGQLKWHVNTLADPFGEFINLVAKKKKSIPFNI